MSKSINLDSLQGRLDEKYQPLEIVTDKETFLLRPVLRCTQAERADVFTKLEALSEAQESEETSSSDKVNSLMAVAKDVITIVTANKRGRELVKILGDDMLLVMEVLSQWQEATQPGEASSSQD